MMWIAVISGILLAGAFFFIACILDQLRVDQLNLECRIIQLEKLLIKELDKEHGHEIHD